MIDILDESYESDLTDEEHERLILMSEHAIAPPFSPAARAVFEAFNSKFDWIEDGVPGPQFKAIAAALRAAAQETGKRKTLKALGATMAQSPAYCLVSDLLAIADEFESR